MTTRYYECYVKGVKGMFFTYQSSEQHIPGEWVRVSFKKAPSEALVISSHDSKPAYTVLPIQGKLKLPYVPTKLLELLIWTAQYYALDFDEIASFAFPKEGSVKRTSTISLGNFDPIDDEKDIYEYLVEKESISKQTLQKHFDKDLIKKLLKEGKLIEESDVEIRDLPVNLFDDAKKKDVELNFDQRSVVDKIKQIDKNFFLVRGVTGCGKTEIYAELMRAALEEGRGVLFLLPEIALTVQFINRFKEEFKELSILHSGLTEKEKGEEWLAIRDGKKKLVLGVRSAIFAPIQDLQYIILDEEHEDSYKQDVAPRYDARNIAVKRAMLENAKLVLGSATPSLEKYYFAKEKQIILTELDKRYNDYKMPHIEPVDMRGKKDILSEKLIEEIKARIEKKEQSIVIVNRKGYATALQCSSCGSAEECRECSVSLVHYKYDNVLKCNYCGYEKPYSKLCSSCGVVGLESLGRGTETLEELIKQKVVGARVVRLDGEVSRKKGEVEKIYKKFLNKEYDVMVGTKLIAKGLDFPNVTLVGIVDSDSLLHAPDFRAAEKTFQLLTQAAGRAGRCGKESLVLIQTYDPEHYAIEKSIEGNYKTFFEDEIEFRKELQYPPFGKLANIIVSSKTETKGEEISQKIHTFLKNKGIKVFPSNKAPIHKLKGRFRYQIFVKEDKVGIAKLKNMSKMIQKIAGATRVGIDIDPISFV